MEEEEELVLQEGKKERKRKKNQLLFQSNVTCMQLWLASHIAISKLFSLGSNPHTFTLTLHLSTWTEADIHNMTAAEEITDRQIFPAPGSCDWWAWCSFPLLLLRCPPPCLSGWGLAWAGASSSAHRSAS